MACRAIVSQWVTAITQSSQHSPCTWLACPSTEAASPSCMDGAPCPDTAQVTTPWPARTREAWPGLSVPRHPHGRLRLRLTRGHGLVAEALGPQPLGPVQAHTEPGPVQAACCDWLPGPAMDALGRPPGVGGQQRARVSLSGPSISRCFLMFASGPGSGLAPGPQHVQRQWQWPGEPMRSSGPECGPACLSLGVHSQLCLLSCTYSVCSGALALSLFLLAS